MTYQAINFGNKVALFHEQWVGWVERSEAHHPAKVKAMGFAIAQPILRARSIRMKCIVVPRFTSIVFSKAPRRPICRWSSHQGSNLWFNVKTAKALGLTVPPALHACADEVIE